MVVEAQALAKKIICGLGVEDQRDARRVHQPGRCDVIPLRATIMRSRYWRGVFLPAGISAELEMEAQALAREIITGMGLEGLLCVEMFVVRQEETASV